MPVSAGPLRSRIVAVAAVAALSFAVLAGLAVAGTVTSVGVASRAGSGDLAVT